MSKTYLIETVSTFVHGYAVEMDEDMDPREVAERIIHSNDSTTELYQFHIGEKFDQCIPLKEGQVYRVFRSKNNYLADLSDDEIIKRFTLDYRKKKEE